MNCVLFAKMDQVFSKENKTLKKYWKIGEKYWKSQGKVREFCQSGKVGTLKMERHFPVREKSGNFEQTGKVRENQTKYWKSQGISDKYYLLFFSDI